MKPKTNNLTNEEKTLNRLQKRFPCSVLFLRLFIKYMKPLHEITLRFRIKHHQYASDIQLCLFSSDLVLAVKVLNQHYGLGEGQQTAAQSK